MINASFVEKRIHPKRTTVIALPGKLFTKDSSQEILCRPIDASYAGFSIFSEYEIDPPEVLVLHVAGGKIDFEIVYGIESPGKEIGYRYGLKCLDPNVDVEKILLAK